jgi:hypothetical protein
MADPNSPAYSPPITLNPSAASATGGAAATTNAAGPWPSIVATNWGNPFPNGGGLGAQPAGTSLAQITQAANSANPSGAMAQPNTGSALGSVNGVPGYGGTFDINNWKDPGYDFRLAQGMKALQGSAAASGGLLSGPTLKAITDYSQGAASQEYQNAFNRFAANRQFNYGVDVGDRSFDYLTQTGDQNFNLQLAQALAGQGQYGTTGAANANQLLASLLSQLNLTSGQVAGQGTIGTSNAVSNALTQGLNYWMQTQNPIYQALLKGLPTQG